ncbi:MAG: hypothetical protein M1570_12375 [Chloroflexi bacterium]|nr:hypothetical protein [Chloroflexota bacterium]
MVQKYIAVLLVLMLTGLTTPAFAQDFVNHNLLPKRFSVSTLASSGLASSKAVPTRAALGKLGVAWAPPQAGQGQGQATKSNSGGLTTKGKVLTWVGVGLLAESGFNAAYGAAILKDPCGGVKSVSVPGYSYSCTSNYSTVRGIWFGASAAVAVTGVILLVKGLHNRQ